MSELFSVRCNRKSLVLTVGPDGMWIHAHDGETMTLINFKLTGYPKNFVEKVRLFKGGVDFWLIRSPAKFLFGRIVAGEAGEFLELVVDPTGIEDSDSTENRVRIRFRPTEVTQLLDAIDSYWLV